MKECEARIKKIREAKNFAEAEKPIKEANLSNSQVELLRTSYQIRDKQPNLAAHFMETVIKEIEEHDKEHEEKKEQEASGEVGGDTRGPLERKDKSTMAGQEPDTGFPGAEDQMREDIMPGLHPDIAKMMQPQSFPSLTMPQQVKQMQYTVQKMMAPFIKEIERLKSENKQLREGIVELDKKVQETTMKPGHSLQLEVPTRNGKSVKETSMGPSFDSLLVHESVEDKRSKIATIDKMMNENRNIYG